MNKRTTSPIVVGTRASALAMWQAEHIVARLKDRFPSRHFELKSLQTQGDVARDVALSEIGTRGIFVREIQMALLAGEIDVGVHSLKDLPSEGLPGTTLAAVSSREDPRDALVSRHRCKLTELPVGARLGTSSPRRAAQLRCLRADLVVESVRGNVDTRVRKAQSQEFDGVVLAAAGLRRLGLDDQISEYIAVSDMLPAPGQGIVAVEVRADDAETLALAGAIDDEATHLAARAERAFVRALGGGCYTPLGAYAVGRGSELLLQGLLADPAGTRMIRLSALGDAADPEALGSQLARQILAAGGDSIMADLGKPGG